MYPTAVRRRVLELADAGASTAEITRAVGVSPSAVRRWLLDPGRCAPRGECPRCDDAPLDEAAYAALLGYYLGDGHISRAPRFYALRISCDATYLGIVVDVEHVLARVRPGMRTFRVSRQGAINVQAHWQHWPCLFPQHGPGVKHHRAIVLDPWQRQIVERQPAAFLRGLFHSDGCRAQNWTRKVIAGELKRYDYPRWQFTNVSDDIRGLCGWALDLLDIPWRRSNAKTISVSTRDGVAALDALIGPKC